MWLYVVVEKIFVLGEVLCVDWVVVGMIGYDFMNDVGVLLYDLVGVELFVVYWVVVLGLVCMFV